MRVPFLFLWVVVGMATGAAGADTTSALLAQLASPDADQREAAAWSLGAAPDPAAVSGLLSALRDPHDGVRLTAAWALAEIGTPEALRAVYALLGGADEGLASFVLDRLEPRRDDPAARGALVRTMTSHPNVAFRARALTILDRNFTEDLLPAFQQVAEGGDATLKIKALPILVRRKLLSSSDDLVPIFAGFLGHPDAKVRLEAVHGLRGFADERVRERLEKVATDPDVKVRRAALAAVAAIVDRSSISGLVRLYDAGNGEDRATIVGSASLERYVLMEPLYRKALVDRFPEPRRLLMKVMLHNVGGGALPAEWMLSFCLQGARDADVEVRARAAACLARHPQASGAMLAALARDSTHQVRVEVLAGMKERGDAAARDIFRGAAADANSDIRVLGLEGMARSVEPEDRPRVLQALLKDPTPKVRAAALAALSEYERSTGPLATAALADPAPEVRAAAVDRVERAKPGGWIDGLGALLDDPSPEVRRAVMAALRYESDAKARPYLLKARAQNAIPGEPSLPSGTSPGRIPSEVHALFVFPGRVPKEAMGKPNPHLLGRYEAVDKMNTPQAMLEMVVERDSNGRIFYTSWGTRDEAEVVDRFTALKAEPAMRYVAFWTPEGTYQLVTWTRTRVSETRGLVRLALSADGTTLTYSQKGETVQPEDPSVTSLKEQFKGKPKKLAEALQRMGLKEGPHTTFSDTTWVFRRR